MNAKGFILATLITGTAMWLLAGIWHSFIVAVFYAEENHANHESIGIIFVAYLILAALMAYLYPRSHEGVRPMFEGLGFGLIVGLLWVFPHGLAMVGAHGESLSYVLKNAVWHLVEQGAGGIVLGLVYSRIPLSMKKPVRR